VTSPNEEEVEPSDEDQHDPGACYPICSPACWRAKLKSLTLTLPTSFQAVPKKGKK
jgi:hypothetical protein